MAAEPPRPVPPRPTPPPRSAPSRPARASAEGNLTSRWMVWVGGVALALGGVFLVKYSIDQGYLGPGVRVLLGVLAGLAMLAAGEAARRHPARAVAQADYVPAMATGAGFLTLFASLYTAYGLYGLLPAQAAFLLLAGTALAALAVSLLHGWAMALLGVIGAMLVPALVTSEAPEAAALFGYLAVVTAALSAICRLRRWWPVAGAGLAAAGLWVAAWLAGSPHVAQPAVVGLFLLLLAALPLWTAAPAARDDAPAPLADALVWSAAAMVALLAFAFARTDDYGAVSLAALAATGAVFLAAAWQVPRWWPAAVAGAAAAVLALAAWHAPALLAPSFASDPMLAALDPVRSPSFARFTTVAALFAALYGGAGLAASRTGRMPGFWAGLSAAVPVLLLFVAYWRWTGFSSDLGWAATAVVLAGIATAAAERSQGSRPALGAYATGAVAALSLALAFALRQAWLTAALSLQLPAIAWIAGRLDLPFLRRVALALATVVLARLLLNPALLDYPAGGWPVLNWILYGYGVPAAAFWAAARLFLRRRDGLTVQVLEAGALAFLVCLVSFQIRELVSGGLGAPYDDLLEASLQSAAWLALGYGLYARPSGPGRSVVDGAALVLRAGGLAHLVLMQVLVLNPLWTHEAVGGRPLLDLLLLAYLLPAGFAALYARTAATRGDTLTYRTAGVAALLLALLWISLETRHWFQGPYLDGGGVAETEQYAYSAVWLLYGAALFAAGLRRNSAPLRIASLAIFMLAAAKVFLFDMASLSGVLRALSFLGLGAALLGIGYLYQRFVQPLGPADEPGGPAPPSGP
ncbi:MAG: DUF2339 domain-containing protein [Alphaproteobacteria bacterium]|nr:DUF2339 domain-containing protein [Alphaproteobacteria bacterium]